MHQKISGSQIIVAVQAGEGRAFDPGHAFAFGLEDVFAQNDEVCPGQFRALIKRGDERVYAAAFFAGGFARSGARQPVFGQADFGLKAVLYGQFKEFVAGALRGQAEQHFFAFVAPLVYG